MGALGVFTQKHGCLRVPIGLRLPPSRGAEDKGVLGAPALLTYSIVRSTPLCSGKGRLTFLGYNKGNGANVFLL